MKTGYRLSLTVKNWQHNDIMLKGALNDFLLYRENLPGHKLWSYGHSLGAAYDEGRHFQLWLNTSILPQGWPVALLVHVITIILFRCCIFIWQCIIVNTSLGISSQTNRNIESWDGSCEEQLSPILSVMKTSRPQDMPPGLDVSTVWQSVISQSS